MTATAHALVGGIIVTSFSNQPLGLALAAISHPLLDLVPHWDFGIGWRKKSKIKLFLEASFDLGLGCVLAYLLFGQNQPQVYFWGAIFLTQFWDLAEAPYWIFRWKIPPFSWVYKIQSRLQRNVKLPWGILTQVTVVLILLLLLKQFKG